MGSFTSTFPSAVSPRRTIKCPPDVNNPGLWDEMTGRPSDNACQHRIGIRGLGDASASEMRSRRLEIGPVGAFPRLIIGIAAPGDCIHRSNGAASQVACYHGKGSRPAAAIRNGAGAVRDIAVFRLDVEGDLHPVRRVSAAGIQYLVIAQDMIHVLLVPVDGIVPAGPGRTSCPSRQWRFSFV